MMSCRPLAASVRRAVRLAVLVLAACTTSTIVPPPRSAPAPEPPAAPAGPGGQRASRTGPVVKAPVLTREFRAVWVTPISDNGIRDWPSRPGLSAAEQQRELRELLDHARAVGLNAIMLHVRMGGDALYATPLAPWSHFLTGRQGEDPGYDPLAFAVREAHARGLQLHAWLNPFRAIAPGFSGPAAPNHVTRAHPEWVVRYGSQTWIDPGIPAARRAVLEIALDIVRRYDIDGLHLDDYFYPYRERGTIRIPITKDPPRATRGKKRSSRRARTVVRRGDLPFPDDASWERYGAASGWSDRAAWRRANINDFVRSLYAEVKAVKPWVSVGISPFGIWRSGVPSGVTGLDAFDEIYADSRKWLTEGWVDYLAPQLYWPVNGTQDRFRRLDAWWLSQTPRGRYVWPGLLTVGTIYRDPWAPSEIAREIVETRRSHEAAGTAPGHVHFRMAAVEQNAALDRALTEAYAAPALVPPVPGNVGPLPATPIARWTGGGLEVRPSTSVPVEWWLVQARDGQGRWTSVLRHADDATVQLPAGAGDWRVLAVTPIDRAGREGDAVTVWR